MDAPTQQLMAQVARYIQVTQPQLDKAAELHEAMADYRVKVAEAIDILVDKGLVPLQEKVTLYDNLAAHPEKAAELLCRLGDRVNGYSHSLGGPSDLADGAGLDPILGFCLGDN